jgi:(p)ppGpp synthase/HD superfamily hydrolase
MIICSPSASKNSKSQGLHQIQVENRKALADIMRDIKSMASVEKVSRGLH